MNKIFKGMLFSLLVLPLFVGNVLALPLTDNLKTVVDAFVGVGQINVQADQIKDKDDTHWELWDGRPSKVTIVAENGVFNEGNHLGIYEIKDMSNRLELFSGSDGVNDFVDLTFGGGHINLNGKETSFGSNWFGWYLEVEGLNCKGLRKRNCDKTYFSETSKNPDLLDHMLAYEGDKDDGKYILAWEDLFGPAPGSDRDFTDMVIYLEGIHPFEDNPTMEPPVDVPVPEPASLVLLGSGLLGLGFFGMKKKVA